MPLFSNNKLLANFSISKINALIESIDPDDTVIALLFSDNRAGVRALARKLEKRKLREKKLRLKQEEMLAIEKKLIAEGKKLIAGIDEAGRGPLAGPVVAAAVILPEKASMPGLDDSKKLTAKRREELYKLITAEAMAWGIGMVDNEEIDEIGILVAAMKAMRSAVANMKISPGIVIIDGNCSPGFECEERLIVDGDSLCRSIAAASIIAKITRDRIMVEMESIFPGYGFIRHKGYGSREHIEALGKIGPCQIHRFSFKIVPAEAPVGTSSAVLKKRLLNASTRESLERAAASISHIRNNLHKSDIESLREIYKSCKRRLIKEK